MVAPVLQPQHTSLGIERHGKQSACISEYVTLAPPRVRMNLVSGSINNDCAAAHRTLPLVTLASIQVSPCVMLARLQRPY